MKSEPPLKTLLTRSEPDRSTLDRVWAGVRQKEARRYRAPLLFGVLVSVSTALIAVTVWLHPARTLTPVAIAPVSPVRSLVIGQQRFAGGVEVTATEGTLAWATTHGEQPVELEVVRGAVHLSVGSTGHCLVTSHRLSFDVAAATVRFDVGAEADSVLVEQGEVAIREAGRSTTQAVRPGPAFTTGPSWKALAAQGNLAGAWAKLGAAGVEREAATASLDERSLLADIAVAGHDLALSISLLEAILETPTASRAERAMAAYGLGLRLLDHGDPARAARAFEQSLTFELPKALQKDARARAAEAYLRAGDTAHARRWLDAAEQ